jgi:hypothetical protein
VVLLGFDQQDLGRVLEELDVLEDGLELLLGGVDLVVGLLLVVGCVDGGVPE